MVVVFTLTIFFDAALAAIVGVLIAVFEYAWDCSTRISIEREKGDNDNVISYRVKGYIFFATANKLVFGISEESIAEDPQEVIILMESIAVKRKRCCHLVSYPKDKVINGKIFCNVVWSCVFRGARSF